MPRDRGTIVQVGSALAYRGIPVKSRLPNEPQPVPPFFQPEIAAEAIVWAAHHDRPEVYVGWPTVEAIVGNKIVPRIADEYLARTGCKSQQTDEPVDPNRRDNLWEPVPGDHGAHGDFDNRAQSYSIQLRATTHHGWLVSAGILLAGLAYIAFSRRVDGRNSRVALLIPGSEFRVKALQWNLSVRKDSMAGHRQTQQATEQKRAVTKADNDERKQRMQSGGQSSLTRSIAHAAVFKDRDRRRSRAL